MKWQNPALETIKTVGVYGLCASDGCKCLNFSVHHVNVDVACRKSSGSVDGGPSVRVGSRSLDYYYEQDQGEALFREIGEEVARQIREWDDEKITVIVTKDE